jgi:pimeloyl-ACP methyl ester carboxylesterase
VQDGNGWTLRPAGGSSWGMNKKTELIDVTRGLLHVPDPRAVPAGHQLLPDCLLVFVHGFASGPEAWKNEPRRILSDLAIECAYFQYRYPSKFWEAADVESASADLRSYLDGNLGKFAHVVFFTHSTGALVVQELLRSSFTPALTIEGPTERMQRLGSLLSRTRSVINLAGAHHGAQPFARSLKWLYNIGWAPVSFLLKRIPVIGKRFGDFKLRDQIQPIQDNDFLRKLTEQYRIVLENQVALGQPCPVRFDYTARIEGVVQQEQDNPARRRNVLSIGYALHFLSSLLTVAGSTLPGRVFPQTMRNATTQTGAASALRWDLAYDSLRFIALIDSEQGVEGLLTDEMNTKSSSRTQKTLFDDIRAALAGNEARILVLSGPGGTGKSVLMRHAARALAIDWLSHEGAANFRLPFTINMKRLEIPNDVVQRYVSNGRQPKDLWDAIKEAWKPVGHALRADRPVGEILIDAKGSDRRPEVILKDSDRPQVTSDWIDECWRGGDTVLFLDSVDEFLNSYRFLGAGDFIALLYYLSGSDNVHRKIVFAIREGEREAIGQLALPCAWFRLDRLSDESTLEFLQRHAGPANTNGTNGAVDHRKQQLNEIFRALPAAARETIATPLVFYKLPNLLDIEEPSKLSTVSGVLELALRKTIEDEPLGRPVLPSEQHTSWQVASPDERLDMLSVLGWIYACDDEGPYRARPFTWLISTLADQKAIWDAQEDLPDGVQRITKAFNNLVAEGGLQACLRRSVFQSVNGHVFDHRQWADLSIARFLSLCILSGVFKPLTERTYHPSIFLRIADYLSVPPLPGFPTSIRRPTIDKMLAWLSRDPRDGQFVIGNFAAIMSHGNFAIDADALAAIMSNLDRIPSLAKHVVLSGFGYRALAENPRDPTAGILKTQIIPAAAEHISKVNPATASLVWSLIRALDATAVEKLGSWPNPDNADAEAIFRMVCPGFPDHDDLAQRISLQNGYVQTTMSMLEDEHRTIASMHYLLFAVMTLHRNAAVADTITELNKILIDMKDLFTTRLQAYERCPEMLELYKLAQAIFREKTGRG